MLKQYDVVSEQRLIQSASFAHPAPRLNFSAKIVSVAFVLADGGCKPPLARLWLASEWSGPPPKYKGVNTC